MDLKELASLSLLVDEAVVQTEVAPGRIVDQHPAGIRNFVRYVVRPFKSVREQFVGPVRAASLMGPEPDDAAFMAALDIGGQMDAAVDDRDDADSTLVALTIKRPKSTKELMDYVAGVKELPDAIFQKLLEGARTVTYGEDPTVFFGQVQEAITGLNLFASVGKSD